jgi:hypothetical protein
VELGLGSYDERCTIMIRKLQYIVMSIIGSVLFTIGFLSGVPIAIVLHDTFGLLVSLIAILMGATLSVYSISKLIGAGLAKQ